MLDFLTKGRVLMFGSEKGGTGKSSLTRSTAAYFANNGADVIILDGDPQKTSAKWVARRNELIAEGRPLPVIHCHEKTGDLRPTLDDLPKRYQLILVDVGGRDSTELRTAIARADILYCPLKPSQDDLDTMPSLAEQIRATQIFRPHLTARSVLSMVPTSPLNNEADEAKQMLGDLHDVLPLSEQKIRERKAYRDSSWMGMGVTEFDSGKAKAEVQLLAYEIVDLLAAIEGAKA